VFVRDKPVPILFADDTSILLSLSDPTDFKNNMKTVFKIKVIGLNKTSCP
jgi:hypothetical protein